MLTKFILLLETHFKNIETALKNQQASIQGLKTQIGQLAKLISKRPQGSLPSNTESNPREQLNAITIQDKEGLVEPELEPRQGIVVSKCKGEVDHSERKPETRSRSIHEPCSNNNKGPIYEEQRLQVNELDEWRTPVKEKPKPHEKSKRHHNEHRDETKQIKVGDKVLLDENNLRIATLEHNTERATPFTILNIFPYGTVEVTHSKFDMFKFLTSKSLTESLNTGFPNPHGQVHGSALGRAHTTGDDMAMLRKIFPQHEIRYLYHVKSTRQEGCCLHLEEAQRSSILLESYHQNLAPIPTVSPGTSGGALLDTTGPTPSHSKASALALSLRYLHAILAHTLVGQRESTSIFNTNDAYFLWSMAHVHVFDLAYFVALAIHHQTERHKKGVISIGLYVTHLARYFDLLNTAAQASSLTLIGQMSPQGISSMLYMRMIER
ncbi:hypothetical protein GOBAR_AA26926 [Gossypium barbadense]|uniref:Uncharacterized protein n=1 Tax=Gossypium barbadense TaxID=3634 RepID=A0A2P5WRL7_GOSBA|nr:hypothetical protein GOBAR_AA26926 [Gossypium barbadense]